jgi:hypothetical protein
MPKKKVTTGKSWSEMGMHMKRMANSATSIMSSYVREKQPGLTVHCAVMAVRDNKIRKTNSNDGCLDEYERAIKHYLVQKFNYKKLDEDIPVLVFELYKHDEDGGELPRDQRGKVVEGKRHQVFIGFVGFGKNYKYKDLKKHKPMVRLMMDSIIKNHWD